MFESESLAKDMVVGKVNSGSEYKAISEASVLNVIKPLFKKYKLILFPVSQTITEKYDEYQGKYGATQRFLSTVKAVYKIVDIETGQFELLETVGYGVDSQDKASGKAITYAYKALLQKTFVLFSGEDTDNQSSDDIDKQNSFKQDKPKQTTDENKVTVKMLIELANKKGVTEKQILATYKADFNKTAAEVKFIPADAKKALYDKLMTKPDKPHEEKK